MNVNHHDENWRRRSNSRVVLLGVLLVIISHMIQQVNSLTYHKNDVVVKNLKLYVDGKEFFVKAMAYQPAPLGILTMRDSGYGGGGFCSAKRTVFGEYKSACFGSDYVDGVTAEKDREPIGPSWATGKLKPWWLDVWRRDFEKLKDMGVNTIRLYNLNPITQHFLKLFPEEFPDVVDTQRGAQHLPFLDLAHDYGFKVIIPILQDESFLKSHDSQTLDKYIESQVRELGAHPALLMWITGNEMNVEEDTTLLDLVNQKMDVIRDRMQVLHQRSIPVTHAVVDLPTSYEFLAQRLKVDVFTTNAGYRDVYLNPLWDGSDGDFSGWTNISKTYNLPLFIGEIGMHQDSDEITQARPYWFNQQWQAIVSHIDSGCVGAAFFEYSDELQKDGKQKTMGAVRFVEALSGGKSSKDANHFVPDKVQEKQFIYQAIKSGIDGPFKQYNMNADVFKLIGRNATKLDDWDPLPVPRQSNSAAVESSVFTWLVLLVVLLFTTTAFLTSNSSSHKMYKV